MTEPGSVLSSHGQGGRAACEDSAPFPGLPVCCLGWHRLLLPGNTSVCEDAQVTFSADLGSETGEAPKASGLSWV